MKTSNDGLYAIARSEGIVPAPYLDSVGVWTYGIGHAETSGLEPNPRNMPKGMPTDVNKEIARAFSLFREKIKAYEAAVNRAINVPLSQHEFDALVSFHFNTGAIGNASATKSINNGDKIDGAKRLALFNKGRVNGKLQVLPGLVSRRKEEQDMFLNGVYPSAPIPVYSVTGQNKPGKVIRTISKPEVIRIIGGGERHAKQKGLIQWLLDIFARLYA